VQITDGRDRLVFSNPAAERVLGWSNQEASRMRQFPLTRRAFKISGDDLWRLQSAVGLAEVTAEEEEDAEEEDGDRAVIRHRFFLFFSLSTFNYEWHNLAPPAEEQGTLF